jgi:hypothetical protein
VEIGKARGLAFWRREERAAQRGISGAFGPRRADWRVVNCGGERWFVAAHAATSAPGILNGTGVGSGAWDGEYSVQSGPGFLYAACLRLN